MKGSLFLVILGVLSVTIKASPLSLERSSATQEDTTQDKDVQKPLSIVDIPADLPIEEQKPVEVRESEKPEVIKDTTTKDADTADAKSEANPSPSSSKDKDVEGPLDNTKDKEDEERPSIFGFRLPTVLIIRRPAIFDEPPSWFQSPFFGGFNRRPVVMPSLIGAEEQEINKKDREPLAGEGSEIEGVDHKDKNDTEIVRIPVSNMFNRVHEQINNLFQNLFNPEIFNMPRPVMPSRPIFARPMFPPMGGPGFGGLGPDPADADSEESGFGGLEGPGGMDISKLPDGYTNSTSETKVVDGHVVEVNKTVQKFGGNNGNGFFQFSVIKVRPSNPVVTPVNPESSEPALPSATGTTEQKDKEVPTQIAENDPILNEVDRQDNEKQPTQLREIDLQRNTYALNNGDDSIIPLSANEEVKIVPIMAEKLIQAPAAGQDDLLKNGGKSSFSDLSKDIHVNNLMENMGQARLRALVDPEEVEVFEV